MSWVRLRLVRIGVLFIVLLISSVCRVMRNLILFVEMCVGSVTF